MENATLMQDYYKAVGEKDFATISKGGYRRRLLDFVR